METLWDVMNEKIPINLQPTYAAKNIASTTRDISDSDMSSSARASRLHAIVYYDKLLHPMIEKGKEAAMKVKIQDLDSNISPQWRAHVDHSNSSFMSLPFINSEMDSTAWFYQVLARPALAAVNLVQNGNLDLQAAFTATTDDIHSYLISGKKKKDKSIPDGLLMKGGSKSHSAVENKEPKGVMEFKTGTAMGVTSSENSENIFSGVNDTRLDGEGKHIALPFVYPEKDVKRVRTKLSKMLVQLWSQMSNHKCNFGLLSCYHLTVFAYRRSYSYKVEKNNRTMNVMFISEVYKIGAASLTPIFSWFLHLLTAPTASGGQPDIFVPDINTDLVLQFMKKGNVTRLEKERTKEKGEEFTFEAGPQPIYTDEYFDLVVVEPDV
ncbi:hypothetical protein SCHPADRAFT_948127 [Schizopora paradoxa]|uniref:Uncharacterized protein n=1 Tax=Schizopora paradoxa TaxID=27342 RepID=A0A0H2QXB5_9AGAM|nr:hypothetical protein SCHPADRAFT_948127 [Schizopora paradoxa]